jgi:hypothetical protein
MTTLIDFIMDLFRSPDRAAAFVQDPEQTMRDAGVPANVTAAQLQAVAATAAPAGVALGGGDPMVGLQRAVADHHNIASPFSPSYTSQPTFAPQTNTDFASHNSVPIASNNDVLSPDQHSGANSQVGGVNIGFGDITFGDKNTASDGSVIVGDDNNGDIDTTNVKGDGNVVGDGNNANTGTVLTGDHGSTNIGDGNDTEITDNSQHAGGDVISGNDGPVINDVDMSGGDGGNASTHSGGGIFGGGVANDNSANAGGGGGGGGIVINDSHNNTNSGNTTVGGDQTNVNAGHDISGGVDASHDDNSVDNSVTDNSTHDNSVHDSHDQTVETNVDVHTEVDAGLF